MLPLGIQRDQFLNGDRFAVCAAHTLRFIDGRRDDRGVDRAAIMERITINGEDRIVFQRIGGDLDMKVRDRADI